MAAVPPLLAQLAQAQSYPLYVGPSTSDLFYEAQGNLRAFTTSQMEANTLQVQDVVKALHNIIAIREQQLFEQHGNTHPMVFYCWVDKQAGQLRFSLVSAFHQKLPFSCTVKIVEQLADVVSAFLHSPYLNGISMSEFGETLAAGQQAPLAADMAEAANFVLDVWTTRLPSAP